MIFLKKSIFKIYILRLIFNTIQHFNFLGHKLERDFKFYILMDELSDLKFDEILKIICYSFN